jgi:hypothetical protein
LVNEYAQGTDNEAALAANRQLLLLEPWSEQVHRQQMLLLAQTGERAAALAQYESCRRILAEEFGVEPLLETTTLYHQIRAGAVTRESGVQTPIVTQPPTIVGHGKQTESAGRTNDNEHMSHDAASVQLNGNNLPPRTKLYGRQEELDLLRKWIVDERCRLVGVFGIGGQGKTALAAALVHDLVEAAPQARGRDGRGGFSHVIWQSLLNAPPLAEVMQEWFFIFSEQTVISLPSSLNQQFSQLLDYLRRHRCLLILDNVESILPSGRTQRLLSTRLRRNTTSGKTPRRTRSRQSEMIANTPTSR